MASNVLRLPAVKRCTGLSRSSIYARVAAGDFPPQIRLGPRAVGWLEHEIQDWIAERAIQSRASHAPK
jgi:prophage regulatory protein